jgi:hypothetical protein
MSMPYGAVVGLNAVCGIVGAKAPAVAAEKGLGGTDGIGGLLGLFGFSAGADDCNINGAVGGATVGLARLLVAGLVVVWYRGRPSGPYCCGITGTPCTCPDLGWLAPAETWSNQRQRF